MKRTYFLVAIGLVQLLIGSILLLGAAAPIHTSGDVHILSGSYHHFEFNVDGSGLLTGNVSDTQGRAFDLLVFDDLGYASFLDGSNAVPPLLTERGTEILVGLNLTKSGQYHVVVGDFPSRGELQVDIDLYVTGLRTGAAIVAMIVLAGGLALVAATLIISVWSTHHPPAVRAVPASDPSSSRPNSTQDPPANDDTRVY